jgi:hypothetical protein
MLGQKYLSESQAVLGDRSRAAGDRIKEAGRLFWRAMILHDAWPEAVKERTAAMLRRLIEHGVVGQTGRPIDEATAGVLCGELASLIADFRAAARKPNGKGGAALDGTA